MTIIVGVRCPDGVIVGADSAYTFTSGQIRTIEQPGKKIEILGDGHVIVTGTGSAGLGQRFCAVVDKAWREKMFQNEPIEVAKQLARLGMKDFASTGVDKGKYGALVAFGTQDHALCEFALDDFQPELKTKQLWYVSMGSGQLIADPFLGLLRDVFWQERQPRTSEAVFAVHWALQHAIKVNPGGVNGPANIAILSRGRKGYEAKMLSSEELDEHDQYIEELKEHMRNFPPKSDKPVKVPTP